jgi:hypothetical protein
LIDWARARRGSPFEDVASWLHSLGCWEPEARRRHDSLLTDVISTRVRSGPAAVPERANTLLVCGGKQWSVWRDSLSPGRAAGSGIH